MILTFVFHLQYCHSGRARSTIREFTIRSRSSGNIPSSRRRPTGANIRAPHPPRIPFSHALAWGKVPEGRMGAGARERDGICKRHDRFASLCGPHPALRATFSHASAREKGNLCVNLAPVRSCRRVAVAVGADELAAVDSGVQSGELSPRRRNLLLPRGAPRGEFPDVRLRRSGHGPRPAASACERSAC